MFDLNKIACPLCLRPLEKQDSELICSECKQAYKIESGIPVILRNDLLNKEINTREAVWKRKEMEGFDEVESYEELMKRPYFAHLKQKINEELDGLDKEKNDVLEVGSGISIFAERFSDKNLVLTDINFSLLQKNKKESLKIVADGEYLPLFDQSFDFIYSIGLIHHLPNQKRGLKELKRLIKPGGQIFISEPTKWSVNLIYYFLRRIFLLFFGHRLLRKLTGCGTPYESFIDLKQVKEIFKNDFEIKTKKILPFRLPPFRFLEKQKWIIGLNRFLEKIPLIKSLGTIIFITLTRKRYYGVR